MHRVRASLPFRPPLDLGGLLTWLGARALPGVELLDGDGGYRRTLALPGGPGILALRVAGPEHAELVAELSHPGDEPVATATARRMLDLDADPAAIDAHLAADPLLAPSVRAAPGRRVPGHADPFELAVRAVIGQQVSVAGARTIAGRLVAAHGQPLPDALRATADPSAAAGEPPTADPSVAAGESRAADEPGADGTLTHLFPRPEALAAIDPASLPMPRARGRALNALGAAVARGEVDFTAPPQDVHAALVALPGIGPWTADYVALRALGAPDVWLPTDLGVKRGLAALGATDDRAERWRPYRSYALMHVWQAGF